MKILLFGEFSGFFNCLRDGLIALGHDVFMASNGDGARGYYADFNYYVRRDKYGRMARLMEVGNLFLHKDLLRGYDVVFVINPVHLTNYRIINNPVYNYLFNNNDKIFISGSGLSPISYNYWYHSDEKYRHYIEGEIVDMPGVMRYIGNERLIEWEHKLLDRINGYIPIWYEYAKPFKSHPHCLPTVRIPVNYNKFDYIPNIINGKIVFFASISPRKNSKGFPYIKAAFDIMEKRYGDVAEFIAAGGLPFDEYMKLISRTNVIMDDANSCSIAMNGLFSLAKGKIVMGGAEPVANKELGLEWNPVYNLCPDVEQICSCIEDVIAKKKNIEKMGEDSRRFVEEYHDYKRIAQQYINLFERY